MRLSIRFVICLLVLSATACQHIEISAPTQLIQLRHDGEVREYWVHIPPGLESGPHPLLLLLHGTDSDGFSIMRTGGFFTRAAKEGFIVLAPNAVHGAFNMERDATFIKAAVDSLAGFLGYKPQTYLVGYNQGAEFAMELAGNPHMELRGLAIVGGLTTSPIPEKVDAVSSIIIIGEKDPKLFSPNRDDPDRVVRTWSRAMHCSTTVRATIDFVRYTTRYGCDKGARFAYLVIGDHGSQWPKAKAANDIVLYDPRSGPYNRHFDAARVIWRFFTSTDGKSSLDL